MSVVRKIITARPDGRADRIETSLREAGLTSLDMVRLVLDIEHEFGVTVGPDDMDPEHFETLDALEALVKRLST